MGRQGYDARGGFGLGSLKPIAYRGDFALQAVEHRIPSPIQGTPAGRDIDGCLAVRLQRPLEESVRQQRAAMLLPNLVVMRRGYVRAADVVHVDARLVGN